MVIVDVNELVKRLGREELLELRDAVNNQLTRCSETFYTTDIRCGRAADHKVSTHCAIVDGKRVVWDK